MAYENASKREAKDGKVSTVTMQMYTNKASKEIANKQLTKAKELLREIIDTPVFNQMGGELYENEGYTELVAEAEQFLKDSEVEK